MKGAEPPAREEAGVCRLDRRKAAVWAVLAGVAQLAIAVVLMQGPVPAFDTPGWTTYMPETLPPWSFQIQWLYAPAYLLLLPAIAYLHGVHRRVRDSGAVLGTLTGTAAVLLGVAQPAFAFGMASLFALGMWWWTIGKLWMQTAVLTAAYLGAVTATLGAIALMLPLAMPLLLPPFVVVYPFWPVVHAVIALWSFALAIALWGSGRSPMPAGASPA